MRPFTSTLPFTDALTLALDAAVPVARTEHVTLTDADGRVFKESWGMASTKAVQDRFGRLDPYERARKERRQLLWLGNSRSRLLIALDPNAAWALSRLGWLEVYADRPEEAAEYFEKANRLSPLDPINFNNLVGIASAQIGRAHV